MTTSPETLREAVERLETFHAACDGMRASDAVISSHGPGGKQVMRADLRTLLSALQEAREALGPFADEFGEYVPRQDSFALFGNLTLGHFRRAAKVFRALSPGGADE